ncbi:MAG: 2,3-diphosphoglycerate-dependent phosphoglycerate mutase, partial [Candidatus Woesearchaeota archaeon]|nr:2,3-diphosphoglycerate-dependent phosphoglycerate mutase [Candidatus Woesearchaeota archaeon]
MIKLVLVRHGESIWNRENRFTGWVDVGLSEKGILEARKAGKALKKDGFTFDIAFSSVLKRATDTLKIILSEMKLSIPVENSWRLNERHYGALQGLNKREMAKKYGEKQVYAWRRGYDERPPALDIKSDMNPRKDPLYFDLKKSELPLTESLKDTVFRFEPYWKNEMAPKLRKGSKILVVAHGNSIRALVKILDRIPDRKISGINIPTGI